MKAEQVQEKIEEFLIELKRLNINAMVSAIVNDDSSYVCAANTENAAEGLELVSLGVATGYVGLTQTYEERVTVGKMIMNAAESLYLEITDDESDNNPNLN